MPLKRILPLLLFIGWAIVIPAQIEPAAGEWKTWFAGPAKDYRLPRPIAFNSEIGTVLTAQRQLDTATLQQITFWNAGAPGYRWQEMIQQIWMSAGDIEKGMRAYMLMGTVTYDATIAAWDSKYAHKRTRPFEADKRIKLKIPAPNSPSYPCEHSVAAGVGATILAHFYPHLADSVQHMAQQAMDSRVAAGAAFPSDTRAGFDLGKKIAEKALEMTRDYTQTAPWDGKRPDQPGVWQGKHPIAPMAGQWKPLMLKSGDEFRPGPPPDFAGDMAELKNFKPNFMTTSNAFFYAFHSFWDELLHKKIFEYNLHLNPPQAARMYALAAVGYYDGFIACWDAKYAYWGTRPDQYDPSYKPVIMITPPFPGYPSGHAAISAVMAELYSSFFPAERAYFLEKATESAESRFQAGIHFRTDNEVGLELGRKVGKTILERQ